jgi:hypothetical protein
MANKCLLSLLVVISITALFMVNAEGLSCYVGQLGDVQSQTCSDEANFGCYRKERDGIIEFGCLASEEECNEIVESGNSNNYCCADDDCNHLKRN